jgi:hypothetical protein
MWLPGEVIDLPEHLARALILEDSGEAEGLKPVEPQGHAEETHTGETPERKKKRK